MSAQQLSGFANLNIVNDDEGSEMEFYEEEEQQQDMSTARGSMSSMEPMKSFGSMSSMERPQSASSMSKMLPRSQSETIEPGSFRKAQTAKGSATRTSMSKGAKSIPRSIFSAPSGTPTGSDIYEILDITETPGGQDVMPSVSQEQKVKNLMEALQKNEEKIQCLEHEVEELYRSIGIILKFIGNNQDALNQILPEELLGYQQVVYERM